MPEAKKAKPAANRYQALIERMFFDHHTRGAGEVLFHRDEPERAQLPSWR